MSPKTGRRDPCPCGSGKRYKNCCGSPNSIKQHSSSTRKYIIGGIALGAVVIAGLIYYSDRPRSDAQFSPVTRLPLSNSAPRDKSQPPGPAPEGLVWSPEHGHWHKAGDTSSTAQSKPGPQPPGPVPEGKVWSAEHGHWHDAPGSLPSVDLKKLPQAPATSSEDQSE